MTAIALDYERLKGLLTEKEISGLQPDVDRLHASLEKGLGAGSDYLGWLHLPSRTSSALLDEVMESARFVRENAEVFICVGIGGSYLGAKAAVEFSRSAFHNQLPRGLRQSPEIQFAGQNISSDYLADLFELVEGKEFCLNVISKSGTTTEPAIAFRLLMDLVARKYGPEEARKRVFATTDQKKGALKKLADARGFKTFAIPDDVGGRYSVLTPVGLLPMAAAGMDIKTLIAGARSWESLSSASSALEKNLSYLYAVLRFLLYKKGKAIELMAAFHPSLVSLMEWWKQLAGESEGKGQRGIFPASALYTTDLHSLGQWVQEGSRNLFETFFMVDSSRRQIEIPRLDNDDGLNFLAGKTLDFVNDKAYKGTASAHLEGGVPNMTLSVKDRSEYTLGRLFYFFERAIAMSGYLLGVNPFDQPGVEFYKKNMFVLLNKPGFGKGS
ncbi:MAG: glucose-6-phosphate isomerase [Nitrospinae bacterium]|nr:glucose-6-phosphate isomerase [Nitrospinota bacterium]